MLHRWSPLATIAVAAALAAGCRPADPPLDHARPSPEALARAALDAIESRDEDALADLMITREEYEDRLWPVLPDRSQMPFDFAWSITAPRSRKARRAAISEYGGVPLELERVELGVDVERYASFTLYRRSRLWVRRTDTGAIGVLPLMDTLVAMDGGWKFMNFIDDR